MPDTKIIEQLEAVRATHDRGELTDFDDVAFLLDLIGKLQETVMSFALESNASWRAAVAAQADAEWERGH